MGRTAASHSRARAGVNSPDRRYGSTGLTLIELIVAFSLMLILSLMALPVARVKIQREQERRLRHALQEIRTAIDRHKDMADQGKLSTLDPDNHGYPPTLEALVEGIEIGEQPSGQGPLPGGMGNPSNSFPGDPRNQLGTSQGIGGAFSSSGLGADSGSLGSSRDPFGLSGERAGLDQEGPSAIRFLRAIPVDPMTGQREWGLLSVSDDPMSRSWSGRNVFDVYSLSNATSLDGTRYSEW